MKILITGGNHAKTLKLLKAFPDHFVVWADYGEVPSIATESYTFASLGKLNESSIAHILLNYCITESIDAVIPLRKAEIEAISKSAVLFGEYGIDVLLPAFEQIHTHLTDAVAGKELAVFIKGNCIFTTTGQLPKDMPADLNGVFSFHDDFQNLQLFTI